VVAVAFPPLDVFELLFDRGDAGLPGLLLGADFGVALLVVLEHVEGRAVLL
jgi:hypothetical protein